MNIAIIVYIGFLTYIFYYFIFIYFIVDLTNKAVRWYKIVIHPKSPLKYPTTI